MNNRKYDAGPLLRILRRLSREQKEAAQMGYAADGGRGYEFLYEEIDAAIKQARVMARTKKGGSRE